MYHKVILPFSLVTRRRVANTITTSYNNLQKNIKNNSDTRKIKPKPKPKPKKEAVLPTYHIGNRFLQHVNYL
jgi:hypothetical protein